ncbi:unnamed protein product [Dibothriocephalus latus]|uniref:Uncharacterized protein n=1 Tax=Dibothriocephalus latus TaxID=60516 RepID=A0A3P7M0E8_DIBLA|nr:unnamed protein product [Dibothriocephalus latus]
MPPPSGPVPQISSSAAALAAPHPPVPVQFKKVHMVFSYNSPKPSPAAASAGPRYLRHEALLKLLPSLRIQATTRQTYGSSVRNLLLTLQCKNISKETTFSITQLTSCSRRWCIELVWPQVEEKGMRPLEEVVIAASVVFF